MPLSTLVSTTYPSIFSTKINPLSLSKNPPPSTTYHPSCIRSARDEPPNKVNKPITKSTKPDKSLNNLDRRDVLLGLGGLYGATLGSAVAAPVQTDFASCRAPPLPKCDQTNCCPPITHKIKEFKFPSPSSPMRERRAAHLVSKEYIEKYAEAVRLMKQLPASDPRNFWQQANVHCAYCEGAYTQAGYDVKLQVHGSWLFFPWHRWYLYFYERILGDLIKDETFALPFWNWDSPDGMTIPCMYINRPELYEQLRDSKHQPNSIVDFQYDIKNGDRRITNHQIIHENLCIMYRQVVATRTAPLFFGLPYRGGDEPEHGAGSVELVQHNIVHDWTGDRNQVNGEIMGALYSAARDPIFFAHHGNVDRLWKIWRENRKDFTDPDYLNASFLFYDENAELVEVKVSDCLDPTTLRYGYQDVEIPWRGSKPTAPPKKAAPLMKAGEFGSKPRLLSSIIRATVKRPEELLSSIIRPTVKRPEEEKENEEEILVVAMELNTDKFVKFDVYINTEDENFGGPAYSNFVGSFVRLPHTHAKPMKLNTLLRLPLGEALEDLKAEKDDDVEVILVPKVGTGEEIIIEGLKIEIGL
ncbi:polyphenol oxidase, chloroplastic-like [Tasmannia lanceolata]|uniref:polyphenol oxidase, chloroplastic-like n=1 Tax=Tasmannia lanceolata TaxID=3420 RepID=UPI004064C236